MSKNCQPVSKTVVTMSQPDKHNAVPASLLCISLSACQSQCNVDAVTVTADAVSTPDLFHALSSVHCPRGQAAGRRHRCAERRRQAAFNEDKCQLFVFYSVRSLAGGPQSGTSRRVASRRHRPMERHGRPATTSTPVSSHASSLYFIQFTSPAADANITTVSINY